MRHTNTKDRMRDRAEFVYRHRELIKSAEDYWTEKGKQLIRLARDELGYSPRTSPIDIYINMKRALKKIPEPYNPH